MTNEQQKNEVDFNEKLLGDFTRGEVNTIKQTIAKDATPQQFNLFMQTCISSGLNPFLNHIYPVIYGGRMSIQVAVEGILHLARQFEDYNGVESQLIHEKDDFKIERIEGEMKITSHVISFPRGKVIGAYAIARRLNKKDVIILMESNEVDHLTKGRNKHMWTTYYNDMFRKHVMKRALKEQFGIEINGESSEELTTQQTVNKIKDVTDHDETYIQINAERKVKESEQTKEFMTQAVQLSTEKNIDLNEYVAAKMQGKKISELKLPQLAGIVSMLKLEKSNFDIVQAVEEIQEATFEEIEEDIPEGQTSIFDMED